MTKYAVTILKAMCKANSENRHPLPFTYYVNKKTLACPYYKGSFSCTFSSVLV